MRQISVSIAMILLAGLMFSCEEGVEPEPVAQQVDESILSAANMGDLNGLEANEKSTGYDQWGLNLQSQNFHGYLINMLLTDPMFEGMPHYNHPPYQGEGMSYWDNLISLYDYFGNLMPAGLLDCNLNSKWNDDLMTRDGVYPPTWVDTDAWITFRYSMNTDDQKWMQLRRLVAVKSTYTLTDGIWYNENGDEVGKASYYWPELMITMVENHGNNPFIPWAMPEEYKSPHGSGYGKYTKN